MNRPNTRQPEAPQIIDEQSRRKLTEAYRKRASDKRFTPAERTEFARMADAWEKTLPQK